MSDEVWTFEPSDPGRLDPLLDGLAHPDADGFPVHICPEPTTEKARFGRTKEIDSGYGVAAMGATFPTGRVRVSDPGVVEHFNRSS